MFDIGFPELLIVSVVALLVLGPERLPEALRTLGLWFGRMRRSFSAVKVEIEREIGMDEVRRQLHNEAILEEMRELESNVNTIGQNLNKDVNQQLSTSSATSADAASAEETSAEEINTEETTAHETTADELDSAMRDLEANVKAADDFEFSNEPHPDDELLNTLDSKPQSNSGD